LYCIVLYCIVLGALLSQMHNSGTFPYLYYALVTLA
jgi:hypothetical protein